MSASLVGSEMCIRDSLEHPSSGPSRYKMQKAARAQVHNAPLGSFRGPVSYTHLTLPTICSV
eukprot:5804060-Alexandrium_andersonii.AAC.1